MVQESLMRLITFVLILLCAVPSNALPKKKTNGAAAKSSSTGSSSGAAAADGVSTATDGSTILDKTVTIK